MTRALVVLSTIATLIGGLFSGVSAAACSERDRVRDLGDWTRIAAPAFEGTAVIAGYAVDPIRPETIYVTDGAAVLKSTDGGCAWNEAFSLGESSLTAPGLSAPTAAIRDVQIPSSAVGRDHVYLLVSQGDAATYVVVSTDGGTTWSAGNGGLPIGMGSPASLAASPTDPATVYVSVRLTPSGGVALFRSVDAAGTWAMMTAPADVAAAPWEKMIVDPSDPSKVWGAGNRCLCVSDDGGRTYRELLRPPATNSSDELSFDVYRRGSAPARLLVFTDSQTYFRSDDEGASWRTGQTADPVTSVVHGADADEIVAATKEPSSRSVVAYSAGDEMWRPISLPSFPVVTDLSTDATSSRAVFGNAGGEALMRYDGPWGSAPADLEEFVNPPGRSHATIAGCPEPGPPAPWKAGWDPAPEGQPVYVTNFRTGYTIKYDSHGTGTVVALAPKYSEGMTLDPLGRLVSTTRFSHSVTRLDPDTCKLEILDHDLYYAEAPTYDHQGNLYVVNTNAHYIWRYGWPQHPRQKPTLVWRMPGFLEDLKFAPPTSPYAGRMFVLYRDRSKDVDDPRVCQLSPQCVTGQPNAVAMLEPTDDPEYEGWKRVPVDFTNFPNAGQGTGTCEGFGALGIAFLPSGHLLVPDVCGSGVIRKYAPDGKSFEIFARIDPDVSSGPLTLTKIAVTGTGHVYVTANNSTCGSAGQNSQSWVFRFDGEGRALNPPFTQHLTCAIGVAAPTGIPVPVPPLPDPPLPEEPSQPVPDEPDRARREPLPLRAAAVAPVPPPPPPPLMAPGPAPAQAPVTELAPAPAPNPAPAQAANPMAAVVTQQQEQPQLAFVMAANTVREQVGEQFAMARVSRSADPLATAKFVLASGALAGVVALGYVSLTMSRARARVRIRSNGY